MCSTFCYKNIQITKEICVIRVCNLFVRCQAQRADIHTQLHGRRALHARAIISRASEWHGRTANIAGERRDDFLIWLFLYRAPRRCGIELCFLILHTPLSNWQTKRIWLHGHEYILEAGIVHTQSCAVGWMYNKFHGKKCKCEPTSSFTIVERHS
jgi:hypothetical protein